jgi:hypothetical protein
MCLGFLDWLRHCQPVQIDSDRWRYLVERPEKTAILFPRRTVEAAIPYACAEGLSVAPKGLRVKTANPSTEAKQAVLVACPDRYQLRHRWSDSDSLLLILGTAQWHSPVSQHANTVRISRVDLCSSVQVSNLTPRLVPALCCQIISDFMRHKSDREQLLELQSALPECTVI